MLRSERKIPYFTGNLSSFCDAQLMLNERTLVIIPFSTTSHDNQNPCQIQHFDHTLVVEYPWVGAGYTQYIRSYLPFLNLLPTCCSRCLPLDA